MTKRALSSSCCSCGGLPSARPLAAVVRLRQRTFIRIDRSQLHDVPPTAAQVTISFVLPMRRVVRRHVANRQWGVYVAGS